jgi:cyclic pyranopterin phosphate synthase
MPDGIIDKASYRDILRYEELLRLIRIGVGLGISKVRITGGEPLIRKGIDEFLAEVGKIDGLTDISLTTNGILLKRHLDAILSAGVRRINVSLDTLDPEKYKQITGYDGFNQVWEGIQGALEAGFNPVKINVVAIKGLNDDELEEIARLTFSYPFHVRFIECMPIGRSRVGEKAQILASQIYDRLTHVDKLEPVKRDRIDGPAERFRFQGAIGEVGLIRPLSHHFCAQCNRLRLTATGKLRVCLLSEREVDLRSPIRNGATNHELADLFLQAVSLKPYRHHVEDDPEKRITGQMSAIGG